MRRWLFTAVLGSAAIAVAYLPPDVHDGRSYLPQLSTPEMRWEHRAGTALARARKQLEVAERAVFLVQQVHSSDVSGPAHQVLFRGSMEPGLERTVRSRVDSLLRDVAPGSSARFVLVVDGVNSGPYLWVFPEAGAGTTCGAMMSTGRNSIFVTREWIARGISRCMYHVAFGQPGPVIDSWLRGRSYDVAQWIEWRDTIDVPTRRQRSGPAQIVGRFWVNLLFTNMFTYELDAVTCIRGNLDRCRQIVLQPSYRPDARPAPAGVVVASGWDYLEGYLLSDLVREMGPERFGRFWRSPLPVDSAFSDAFGTDLGTWAAGRQRARMRTVPGTTMVGGVELLKGLLTMIVAVAAAAAYVQRRRVA